MHAGAYARLSLFRARLFVGRRELTASTDVADVTPLGDGAARPLARG
jgi:hypothetical protein